MHYKQFNKRLFFGGGGGIIAHKVCSRNAYNGFLLEIRKKGNVVPKVYIYTLFITNTVIYNNQ